MKLEEMTAEQLIDLARKQEAALSAAPACADPVVETNVALLRSRSAVGIEKYGTTVAGNNLPLRAWLNHALEETLDNANYLQRAMQEIDAAPAPATPAASVDTAQYAAGRQQGRAEALAILMELDPEGGIEAYTGWSAPVGPEDEGSAYWEVEKLRELFAADSSLVDMMDKAESEYWHCLGLQDEAVRAKNFAANMHSSGKVRDVLAKAGEFDLMGQLCAAAPQQHAQAAQFPPRDISKPAEQQGIFEKFRVQRTDGSDMSGGKHHGCKYFVLDLDHDIHAGMAMRAYAKSCRATHPVLAEDIENAWGRFENDPALNGRAQAALSGGDHG